MRIGRCDCGKVKFEIAEARDTVTVCHCTQCRRTSGHVWVSTHVPLSALNFIHDDGLQWYVSSDWAKRGFCKFCGSSLFYRMKDEDWIAVAAGCLEAPTGLTARKHIFVADKGDYYEISDGLQQIQKY